jgi:hypothetical protein
MTMSATGVARSSEDVSGREQAVPALHEAFKCAYVALFFASCGPKNALAITDEFGHKYNCRGDRIR